MSPDKEAQQFLTNGAKMEKLHQAMSILHEIGFERVMRRLGEPMNLATEHPHFSQIAAAQTSENIGWYKAVDTMFNFQAVVGEVAAAGEAEADYGGKQIVEERMGYTDKEEKV